MNNRDLWELSDDQLAQQLIRHGRAERAPSAARRLVSSGALAAAGSTLATSAAAAGAARSVGWLVVKWLAVGATSGVAVMTLATSLPPSRSIGSPKPVPVASEPRATRNTPARRENVRPASADGTATDASGADAPSTALRSGPGRAQPSDAATNPLASSSTPMPSATDPSLSLQEELGLLQQARAALVAHASESAFAALSRYEARFPAGRMHVEALALRTEAYFVAGQAEAFEQQARAFLANYPQNPAALRVRRLLDASLSGRQ